MQKRSRKLVSSDRDGGRRGEPGVSGAPYWERPRALLQLLHVIRPELRQVVRQRQLVGLARELERYPCHSIHFRTNWIRSSSPSPCDSACLRQPSRLSRRSSIF